MDRLECFIGSVDGTIRINRSQTQIVQFILRGKENISTKNIYPLPLCYYVITNKFRQFFTIIPFFAANRLYTK